MQHHKTPRFILAGAVGLMAGVATAQDDFVTYLDRPEACAVTQDMDCEERPFRAIHDGGAMLPSAFGMDAVEYVCEFEQDIVFDWMTTTTQIRAGYCAEPANAIFPQVLVIGMSEAEPGVVMEMSAADPTGEPLRFTACRQM